MILSFSIVWLIDRLIGNNRVVFPLRNNYKATVHESDSAILMSGSFFSLLLLRSAYYQ